MPRTKSYSKCRNCGKDFPKSPSSKKIFCSSECRKSYKYTILECESCGDYFKRLKSNDVSTKKFCSRSCYLEAHNTKPKKCIGCGCMFCKPGDPDHKFCSRNCYNKAMPKGGKPFYNKNSIPIIEQYGKDNGYIFQHAENGGEYFVRGYYLDAYDPKKNVVLEYMERHHKYTQEKDSQRKKEIVDHLGCKWIEIWEK